MSAHKNYPLAASLALTAFCGWTVSDSLLKLMREANVPQGQMMLISGLSGVAVIFLMSALRGKTGRLQAHKSGKLLAIGICQWLAFVFWITALPHLPLGNMYVVTFLTPMVVACLAAVFLKEHLGWKRAVPIAGGFLGVVIAVNPMQLMQQTGAWVPYTTVGAGMLATATQMLLLRAAGRTESSESMAFYPRLVIVAAGAISCATQGFAAMPARDFLALCASGALGAMGWALLGKAYKNAPAAAVAPFQYAQIVGGTLLGYFIWGDVPSWWLVAGAAVIVAAGVYLVTHERRVSRTMMRVE